MNHRTLSKEISYALRHAPDDYDLKLDDEGWVDLDLLVRKLGEKKEFSGLTPKDVYDMIEMSEKKRHEMIDNKIRATYGHSVDKKIIKAPTTPPDVLYHGTARKFIDKILTEGLIPKGRQYVHLSEDIETATIVGKRRDEQPVILKIDTKKASIDGVQFYSEADKIWLSDKIPAKFLEIM